MKESTVQLDVKEQLALPNKIDKVRKPEKTEREIALAKYTRFFKRNMAKFNITDPNYTALEIVNDEGLMVSRELQEDGGFSNFKICNIGVINTLIENPVKLSQINLVHAVMPFDDVYSLIKAFAKIPELTNAKTRVVLGTYDNYDDEHDRNIRILNNLIRELDFSGYHCMDEDGTALKMVYSTYQKNLRMRH